MALTDKDGISTTKTPGQFAFVVYYSVALRGERVQWDYRDTNGMLHSGVAGTIEQAMQVAERFSGEKIADPRS